MMYKSNSTMGLLTWPALAFVVIAAAGCPDGTGTGTGTQTEYDLGFNLGFAIDDWYWDGYWDGYDTLGVSPVYYDDSEIPYYETPLFDAGYWDGVWYAYNDGYFVDYHYAFIIGFSEGYDNAFWPDYLAFLALDTHAEYMNGGWGDGYEDGFSEGRIFGASDYEQGLPFDWLDALYDYESGTDLYFVEVDKGTGAFGPVILYEYGTNPTLKSAVARKPRPGWTAPSIRQSTGLKDVDLDSRSMYRALTTEAYDELDVMPSASLRSPRPLDLTSTWVARVNAYQASTKSASKHVRTRLADE
ncbi:MAG: hypothetical protein GY851_18070 [bacterium]|nr:hypothetical protein [bacterium]